MALKRKKIVIQLAGLFITNIVKYHKKIKSYIYKIQHTFMFHGDVPSHSETRQIKAPLAHKKETQWIINLFHIFTKALESFCELYN